MNIDPWSTRRSLAALDAVVLESLQASFESPEWSGPSTGLVDLDRLIGPLLPGKLLLVRGREGSGRSTMLITAALGLHSGLTQQRSVGILDTSLTNA